MNEPGQISPNEESTSLPHSASSPTSTPTALNNSLLQNGTSASMVVLGSDSPKDSPASATGSPITDDKPSIPTNPEDLARLKRQYVLNELVETERDYVRDLASVVEGYIANLETMELPEDLLGKDKDEKNQISSYKLIIFANIQQILEFHKTTFLKEVEKSLADYNAAGQAFVKHERRLHAYYVKYCQNKPKSDYLVSQESFEGFFAETKQKLGHKVALCDLLIKPVQRIMKYQLMLKDVLKYTEKAGDNTNVLLKALDVMHVVPKACDDMMQVGRLQNFEGNLNAQGRLLFQGTLLISDGGPSQPFKGKERRIFLFEQSAILADCILPKREYGNPTYIFKNQIMVNKMVLDENVSDEPLRFILASNDPIQPATFVAEANSPEDREQWLAKLNAQLDQQKTFLAALVDPKKYQNQLANLSINDIKKSANNPGGSNSAPTTASPASHSNSPLRQGSGSSTKSSKLFGFVSVLSGKSKQ